MFLQIQREVAFEKTSKEVSRWQSVVIQNQRAEQLFFPLNQEPSGPKRMEQVVAGWKVGATVLCDFCEFEFQEDKLILDSCSV